MGHQGSVLVRLSTVGFDESRVDEDESPSVLMVGHRSVGRDSWTIPGPVHVPSDSGRRGSLMTTDESFDSSCHPTPRFFVQETSSPISC